MGKVEIIAGLSQLTANERLEVQARLDELATDAWIDPHGLSEADKHALDEALADYEKNPNAGSSWDEAAARIKAKLDS